MSRGRANLASSLERIDQRRQRVEHRVTEARTHIEGFVDAGGAELAGFDNDSELLNRLLFGRPHLQALIGSLAENDTKRRRPKVLVPRAARATTGDRPSPSNRMEALSKVVSLVSRLEDGIARDVRALQDQLATIDRDGQWRDCAYLSYEEFLERALGPDPRLSLLLSVEPPPKADALARVSRTQAMIEPMPTSMGSHDASSRTSMTPPSSSSFGGSLPPAPTASMPPSGTQMSGFLGMSVHPPALGMPEGMGDGAQLLSLPPEAMIEENPDDEPPAWLSMAEAPAEETAMVVPEPIRPSRQIVVQRRAVPPLLAIQLVIAALAILIGAVLGWSSLHQSAEDPVSEAH